MLTYQNVDLFGDGLGDCPSSPPHGPGTVRTPEGRDYWECRDMGMRVCLAMYGGNKYRDTEVALEKAGLEVVDHPNVLGVFKAAQRAVNAYSRKHKLGLTDLYVDGRIGPKTTAALATVLAHMGQSAPGDPDAAALAIWCQRLDKSIAAAAGTTSDTTTSKKPGERPKQAPTAAIKSDGGASGKLPEPGEEGSSWTWAWWLLGGLAAVGVVVVGVSWARGQAVEQEGEVFPAT